MFTGIIEDTAKVLKNSDGDLMIECPSFFTDIKIGSSIAVSGVCLTVVKKGTVPFYTRFFGFLKGNKRDLSPFLLFHTVPETLSRTTLGEKGEGDFVNLERAMKADARFEGHVVQGHVEGVAEVVEVQQMSDGSWEVSFAVPENLLPYIIEKGSIALEGISLTVARLEESLVTIALIPHTLEVTTFGTLKKGSRVNVETDVFARYALRVTG